jgi:hypothetical protein
MTNRNKLLFWTATQVVIVATSVAIPGNQWWLLGIQLPAAFLTCRYTYLYVKETRHGSNRRTQADHPDPQALGEADITLGPILTGGTFTRYRTGTNTGMTYRELTAAPTSAIDTVQEDMPILAHRAARLHPGRGGMTFASINKSQINGDITFGVDADATCHCRAEIPPSSSSWMLAGHPYPANHKTVPDLHGNCGWYAVPSDMDAWHAPNTVDLLVELSGRVIEHEQGYRAEHQRVIEIRLPGCWLCGQPTTHALFDQDECKRFACENHLAPDLIPVRVGDIQRLFGIPVVAEP